MYPVTLREEILSEHLNKLVIAFMAGDVTITFILDFRCHVWKYC